MKTKILIPFLLVVFALSINSKCKRDLAPDELEEILSQQMKNIETANSVNVNNEGYFQVSNLNEEIAPYLMGAVVIKKSNAIEQIACGNLLSDGSLLDTEIKFNQPDVLVYINRSAQVNIKALDLASINMSGEDKLKIIYEKIYAARPKQATNDWFDLNPWYEFLKKNQINTNDTFCMVNSVVIKRLTYSVYKSISAGFSASPTPMLAIDGKVFQESGLEQNKYEVFVNLVKLPFPSLQPLQLEEVIAPPNIEVKMLKDPEKQMQQIIQNQAIKKNYLIKKYQLGKNLYSPRELDELHRINN